MKSNSFKVKVNNKINSQSVTFQVYEEAVSYQAQNMNNVTGIVYGNKVTYPNAWQSTDLEYQVQNDQLKMELHLADNQAPKSFNFELKMKGVKQRLNADGSIDFVDKDGKVNFRIPQMWVQDSSSDALRYDRLKVAVQQVYAYGVPQGALKVEFPTWTANNLQDDLEFPWIQGQKVIEGIWKITIPFSNHNSESGIYHTDVYVDGAMFRGSTTQVNPASVIVTAPATIGLNNAYYDIYINGVNSQVAQVLFPTWTVANGQDDLETPWIQGQRVSERKWKISIPLNKHNYETGNYITDIYSVDNYGNRLQIGSSITNALKSISTIPTLVSKSSTSYDVYAYGIPKGALQVQFPTWTLYNGFDDIESPWIQGQKVADGIWKITIPFSKHNMEKGLYETDVYVDGVFWGGAAAQVNP